MWGGFSAQWVVIAINVYKAMGSDAKRYICLQVHNIYRPCTQARHTILLMQ